jgi:hypothetical protein
VRVAALCRAQGNPPNRDAGLLTHLGIRIVDCRAQNFECALIRVLPDRCGGALSHRCHRIPEHRGERRKEARID